MLLINVKTHWKLVISGILQRIFFDIGSHVLSGACVILAFISGGTKISQLALVAGALGTSSQVFFQFSLYCYKQYQLQSDLISKISVKEHVNDDLVSEAEPDATNASQPTTTPTNTPITDIYY